ncbi:glycosyltransferase family protein [Chelativorans salis]|uniref:Spore protein YkvP/CgeB glycosyl transferase-like domain-containing protein n=1 Tax=Chelativorans salis TaxID=2978478 RepID=A0ABT2LX88_9HYPH|nr:hypothetical protein [Chelativorans sp. EGI FJ00035]MCT7378208.1 hypothetical protein [Chelativorans sp. EGI FJ00035]
MSNQKRVLICANPDLNFIDGSSIWAQTIALVIAETGLATVDFLAKSTLQRYELFGPLCNHPRIEIINGARKKDIGNLPFGRLSAQSMAELSVELDRLQDYDLILVRGYEIAQALLETPDALSKSWIYLTNIPQKAEAYSEAEREEISRIAFGCAHLLCQTSGFRKLWKTLVPDLPDGKCTLYPPVIPDIQGEQIPIASREKLAVYAGKFTPQWMTLEMAENWPELQHLDATLRMIGDKIHVDARGFERRMRTALEKTPRLEWLGAMSREEVQAQLRQARVGLSWRAESMNDTLEFSTKILEYGGAGCAAILNRNPLHEELLGEDYPLFANTREQYLHSLETALVDDELSQTAADQLMEVSKAHTFSARVQEVSQWLNALPSRKSNAGPASQRKLQVLIAGHDLKFFKPLQKKLEETGKFAFLIDKWSGHNEHDEKQSRELLPKADVIFCEWCLGNLKWYSKNRLPHQRLIARFHAQERKLPFLKQLDQDHIDHISFVSEPIRREGQKVFHFPEEKTSVIANYLDPGKFFPKKKIGDARYTLGMIGSAPASKRLDRAIDLLERLLEQDSRYCLRVKGRHPLDYEWLLKRPEECEYYCKAFERINSHKLLSTRVIFDPPGDDVNDWLSMVGFILSPSDTESFHMAIGEGLLAGCRPIIWPWEGAAETWGSKHVIDNLDGAAQAVLTPAADEAFGLPTHMEPTTVVARWERLLTVPTAETSHAEGELQQAALSYTT